MEIAAHLVEVVRGYGHHSVALSSGLLRAPGIYAQVDQLGHRIAQHLPVTSSPCQARLTAGISAIGSSNRLSNPVTSRRFTSRSPSAWKSWASIASRLRSRSDSPCSSSVLAVSTIRVPDATLNYELRKIIKNSGHIPNDDAVVKLLWLAIRDIEDRRARERSKEAGRPKGEPRNAPPKLVGGAQVQGWNQALGALSIAFPGRLDAVI